MQCPRRSNFKVHNLCKAPIWWLATQWETVLLEDGLDPIVIKSWYHGQPVLLPPVMGQHQVLLGK